MRILYIIPGFDEGGAEVHTLNLIRELSQRHTITLATTGGRLEKDLPENVKVIHLPVERKNLFTVLYSAGKLAKINDWDIIHVHSRVPAWVAWRLASITKTKWIMTAHALYSLNAGLIAMKHADGVICISEAVKNHLKKFLPDNTKIIYNGIIFPKVFHENFSHDAQKNNFLFVGRLTRLKCLDVVLRALSELKNYDFTLDVIGDGPQRKELENLSSSLGLNDRVIFHGSKEKNYVYNFMARASCLLFPSKSEGMGLVVLEAATCGLPVLASDLDALREISESELIPVENVEAWTCAIKKFLDEKVSCSFNPEKIIDIREMASQTENFYASIIKDDPKK